MPIRGAVAPVGYNRRGRAACASEHVAGYLPLSR